MDGCNRECDRLRDKIRAMAGVTKIEADEAFARIERLEREVERLTAEVSRQKGEIAYRDKREEGEINRAERYKDALEWVRENVMMATCYEFVVAVNKALDTEEAQAIIAAPDCRRSDSWRCANDKNLGSLACPCECHKPPRKCTKCGELTAHKALRLVAGGSSTTQVKDEWCMDCIAVNDAYSDY